MSLCLMPTEILVSVCGELGYGSEPIEYHRTALRSLKSLRLTSRYIGALATELLFQRYALVVGYIESWFRIYGIARHQEIAKYMKVLNFVDLDARIGPPCLWITGGLDLALLPEINSITIFNTLRASRSPAKINNRAERCPLEVDAPLISGWLEDFLRELIKVSPRQGFQIVALEFKFPYERTWDWISPSINIEYLQSLNLTLRYLSDPDDVEKLQTSIVPAIKNMPAFKILLSKATDAMQPSLYIRHESQHYRHAMEQELAEALSLGNPLHIDESCRTPGVLIGKRTTLQTFHLCVTPKGYLEMEEDHIDEKDLPVLKNWIELTGIVPGGLTMFTGKPDEEAGRGLAQELKWAKKFLCCQFVSRYDEDLYLYSIYICRSFMVISCLWSDLMRSGLEWLSS